MGDKTYASDATNASGATLGATPETPDRLAEGVATALDGATAQYELPLGKAPIVQLNAPLASVAGLSPGQRMAALNALALWSNRLPPSERLTPWESDFIRKVLYHDGGAGCTVSVANLRRGTFGNSNAAKDRARASVIRKGFVLARSRGRRKTTLHRVVLPQVVIDDALVAFVAAGGAAERPAPPKPATIDIDVETWQPPAEETARMDATHAAAVTAAWRDWARKRMEQRTERAALRSWRGFLSTVPVPARAFVKCVAGVPLRGDESLRDDGEIEAHQVGAGYGELVGERRRRDAMVRRSGCPIGGQCAACAAALERRARADAH